MTSQHARTVLIVVTLVLNLALTVVPSEAQTLPAQSFAELRPRLKVGDRVIVRDQSGDTSRGKLVSLTGAEMEIEWVRWFHLNEQTFTEVSVSRIERQDSNLNGALIGLAVGVAGMLIFSTTCDEDLGCLMPIMLSPFFGLSIGALVDGATNETLYISPGTSGANAPTRRNRSVGLALRLRF